MIDTHAHLDFPDFDEDRDAVLERARNGGVHSIVTIGTDPASARRALEIAFAAEGVHAGIGIHPNHCAEAGEDDWRALEELLDDERHRTRIVAIGETGLDFYRDRAPRDVQESAFRRHIRLARRHGLPLVVHCRSAYDRCAELVEEEFARDGAVPGVMHCYSGTLEQSRRFLALGFHLSFAGPITYKKNDALRAVAQAAPLERIVVETDCPFLPPEPHRGKRNEPAYVRLSAEALARARDESPGEVEAATDRNALALFRLPGPARKAPAERG